jgi:hypothetical protein
MGFLHNASEKWRVECRFWGEFFRFPKKGRDFGPYVCVLMVFGSSPFVHGISPGAGMGTYGAQVGRPEFARFWPLGMNPCEEPMRICSRNMILLFF